MLEVLLGVDHLIFLEITNRFLSLCFVSYFSPFVFYDLSDREKNEVRNNGAHGIKPTILFIIIIARQTIR